MPAVTDSWKKDFFLLFASFSTILYITYGTWVFKTIIFGLSCLYLFFQYRFLYWRGHGIPHTSPTFPLGDVSALFWKAPGDVLKDVYDRGKGHRFIGVWFGFRPAILLRDPELMKQILVKDFRIFHDRGVYLNQSDPLMGHIFFITGRKWRNTRAKLTPTFTSGKLKAMFPQFLDVANRFEAHLSKLAENEQIVDVKELASRYTTDLTTLTAFGVNTNAIDDADDHFRKIGRRMVLPSFFLVLRSVMPFLVPDLSSWIRIRTVPGYVTRHFLKAMKEIVKYREDNDIEIQDFLGILLKLKNKGRLEEVDGIELKIDGEDIGATEFTFSDLAAEAFVFFIAGFETAAIAITWAIYEMARNPEIQAKARQEMHETLRRFDGNLSYAALQEMKYLDQIVEGMRYSMMQKKVGLVAMLNKFEFQIVEQSPVPLEFDTDSFVFNAKGGMMLKIKKI